MPFRPERRRDERFRDPRLDSDHAESAGRANYYDREHGAVAGKSAGMGFESHEDGPARFARRLRLLCFKSNRHEIARRVSAARSYGGDGI